MELRENLYRLPLPLGNNPLGFVNAYLVTGGDGCLLIDCGWDSTAIRETFEREFDDIGIRWSDLRTLLLTHAHPDHYGASGWIKEQAPQVEVIVHRAELPSMRGRFQPERMAENLEDMASWLQMHGMPDDDVQMAQAMRPVMTHSLPAHPDRLLIGGERIVHGDWAFDVHWTPGHASGQICLHDIQQRVLISADHVLPRITPAVTLHPTASANPLGEYVDSLRAIRELDPDVDLILPGHGEPFSRLAYRVDEILHHHEARLGEMLAVVNPSGTGSTAHDVASGVPWRGGRRPWSMLSSFDHRMAVMETLSHLEVLHGRGDLHKRYGDGYVRYHPTR